MKKLFFAIPLFVALASCHDDAPPLNPGGASLADVSVIDGRLAFLDTDHFDRVITQIEEGKLTVDDKIPGLDYESYFSTLPNHDFKVIETSLDLVAYQVLLNENREMQIGDNIISFNADHIAIQTVNGKVIRKEHYDISHLDQSTKTFVGANTTSTAREFNDYSTVWIPEFNPIGFSSNRYNVRYRWTREKKWYSNRANYYYEAQFNLYTSPIRAQQFRRDKSDCTSCTSSTGESGGTWYNTTGVRWFSGSNYWSKEHNAGAWLRAVYYVRFNNKEKLIYQIEDLATP